MGYNPDRHDRHSIRLPGYDYAAGAYFVTICLNQRIPKIQTLVAKGQPRRVAPTAAVGAELEFDFPTFGSVENGVMVLNDSGKMIQQIWNEIPKYYSSIETGEFIVMPDHIHGIIKLNKNNPNVECVGAAPRGCHSPFVVSLPYLIYCIKTSTTNKYIDGVKTFKWKPFHKKLWQRNYYERIIRNEAEYARIAKYIRNNPISWGKEHLNYLN